MEQNIKNKMKMIWISYIRTSFTLQIQFSTDFEREYWVNIIVFELVLVSTNKLIRTIWDADVDTIGLY